MLPGVPLLLVSGALAGSVAEQIPSAPAPGPGLVVLVQDAGGRYPTGTAPTGTVEDRGRLRAFALQDDGQAPDAVAGDGVHSALVPLDQRGGLARFTLLDAGGGVLWSDDLPIGLLDNPMLRVHLEADREAVLVQTNDVFLPEAEDDVLLPEAEEQVLPELVGWNGPPWDLPPMGLGPVLVDNKRTQIDNKCTQSGATDGREEVASLLPPVLKGPLLLAGVLLMAGGVALVARRPPPLSSAGRAVEGPGRRETRDAPPTDADFLALVRGAAAAGPVLLLPSPDRAAALTGAALPHVVRLGGAEPDLPEIKRAAESLRPLGRVTVLIDGPAALTPALAGEQPDAAVRALLAALPADVDAVALRQPPPPPESSPGSPESVPPPPQSSSESSIAPS
jgi:hypothetical protein